MAARLRFALFPMQRSRPRSRKDPRGLPMSSIAPAAAHPGILAASGAPLLTVDSLHVHFVTARGVVRAVEGISYDVRQGEMVALVGESGCGKSVSALAVMRLLARPAGRIVAGRVVFEGRDLLQLSEEEMREVRGRDISMIFQEPMTSLNPVLTIGLQIMEPLFIHKNMERGGGPRAGAGTAEAGRHPRPGTAPRAVSRTSSRAACASA